MTLPQLRRIRWGVRAVLTLGVAASVAGNVLHAQDSIISRIISAWSPLALLLTIELISRVPVHSRRLAIVRWAATALIAGIAAWVSYWHMAAVASRYGETGASPYLLPLSVDGLVVVASVCLVELAGQIRVTEDAARVARPQRPAPAVDLADLPPDPMPESKIEPARSTASEGPPILSAAPPAPVPDPGTPTGAEEERQRQAARAAYRRSVRTGKPLSGAELGRRHGMSARWGRDRVAEVRAAQLADAMRVGGKITDQTPINGTEVPELTEVPR